MSATARMCGSVLFLILIGSAKVPAQSPGRVTVIYDAFGASSALEKDWGFAALVEYGDRRILFDTGNNACIFEHNVRELGIDLSRLDAAVISHRHGDHTSGLPYLLACNPDVKIFAPREGAFFKSPLPQAFLQSQPGLPPNMHYFEGAPPKQLVSGTPWVKAHFQIVSKNTEIFPGFYVLTTRSEKPGTVEMNELSLAIRTPRGLAIIVGCSHPGVEKILSNASSIDPKLYTVTGGFHLVMTPENEVRRIAGLLMDELKIERVAPEHCTSELGFAVFMERFKDRFDAAGLGSVLRVP